MLIIKVHLKINLTVTVGINLYSCETTIPIYQIKSEFIQKKK